MVKKMGWPLQVRRKDEDEDNRKEVYSEDSRCVEYFPRRKGVWIGAHKFLEMVVISHSGRVPLGHSSCAMWHASGGELNGWGQI